MDGAKFVAKATVHAMVGYALADYVLRNPPKAITFSGRSRLTIPL